jgi:Uma2 family endonuclease
MAVELREETIVVPASARFPIELEPPKRFRPEDETTWPPVAGRLEWVGGRLLYMPPCGDLQQLVTMSAAGILMGWQRDHRDFVVGGNEAGMILGGDVRGADAAVWRRIERGPTTGGYVRVPPILAVEIAGQGEDEPALREKASWYLGHGVELVWLVLPRPRDLVLITREHASHHRPGDRLPSHPALPGLEPNVAEFFAQLD